MKKRWIQKPYDRDEISRFAKDAKIKDYSFAVLLYLRGFTEEAAAKKFVKRDMKEIPSPFLFRDMQKCCVRIEEAISNSEKITIYGDYDVDGITSISILYRYLKSRNAEVSYYVPDRAEEGYGVNLAAVEKIAADGTKLLITVDCGITACAETERAKELGMDVIITDHHECGENLPDCIGILDPKMGDYPFAGLAGVGVTFKLISALMQDSGKAFRDYGELLTVGTIADIVPLTGENRIYVYHGLQMINRTKDIGLRKLLDLCGYRNKKADTYSIAFGVAPRINAAGRMESAKLAIDLFVERETEGLAEKLCELNIIRQQTEGEILEKAFADIEKNGYQQDKIIVVADEGWHHGVIGIIASKIADRYCRPVIVLSIEGETAKGSCRSVKGFNIYNALADCSAFLLQYGGHAFAAGLSLETGKIAAFRNEINRYAEKNLPDELLGPILEYDLELEHPIGFNFVEKLSYFEPFGVDNPKPLFVMRNITVHNLMTLTQGKHLKFFAEKEGRLFDCIAFSMGEYFDIITNGSILDIIFEIGVNEYGGHRKIQFTIKDFEIKA